MCGVLRIRVVARFLHKLKSTGKRVESRVLCHNNNNHLQLLYYPYYTDGETEA